jgi:hypothetical protein
VKLAQFGDFRVAAWAKQVGDQWIGNFRIHNLGVSPSAAPSVPQEGQCEHPFSTREDATDAAYIEGVESLVPILRSRESIAMPRFY